jgi:mono/diheme cytochrome c family protein
MWSLKVFRRQSIVALVLVCLGCYPASAHATFWCHAPSAPQPDGSYAKLSDTGLYCDTAKGLISVDVRFFEPENQLWADGAQKRRFMQLPPGTQIDTTDMDKWRFPVGTKVWKEFFLDGRKLETRLLEKRADGTWYMMAFAWNETETDALPVPDGEADARDTPHDIPPTAQCNSCHRNAPDFLLGVQAMQLARANPFGVTLLSLILSQRLTALPAVWPRYPGNKTDAKGLGYLLANCSNCHRGTNAPAGLDLFTSVYDKDVQLTQAYLTAVNQPLTRWLNKGYDYRIVAGDPAHSAIVARMSVRGTTDQMPRIATEEVDVEGVAAVSKWIATLK